MPKRVRLLRDEIVAYGPQRLHGGEVYDLPDGLAQHLVRQGVDLPSVQPALRVLADQEEGAKTSQASTRHCSPWLTRWIRSIWLSNCWPRRRPRGSI